MRDVVEHRKFFEVRDEGTRMPLFCFKLIPTNEDERYVIGLGGFGPQPIDQEGYIIYYWPTDDQGKNKTAASYDYYRWHPSVVHGRTQFLAMQVVRRYWDLLESGDVIDVQYAIGESDLPKLPDKETGTVYDTSGRMEWMKGVIASEVPDYGV